MKIKINPEPKEILTVEEHELDICKRADEINTITDSELKSEIVTALKKTIKKNNLTSLSAPAIGYDKRIFCIKFKEEIKTFINPVIIQCKGLELSREKCSSIPNKEFIIPRNNDVTITYQRPLGQIETRQLVGIGAFIVQHEIQHLDGILISDIGLEIDEDWDKATEEEREEILNLYLDSLDIKQKDLDKEIEENPELKQMSDAIDFMTSVYKGETQLEYDNIKKEDKD